MGNTRIVYAPRPAKLPRPARPVVTELAGAAPPVSEAAVPSREALVAFAGLLERWRLPAGAGWRALTGQPARERVLTEDQARRVQMLLAMEAMLSVILTGCDVGAWMEQPNPGPLLAGRSPLDYLTRTGTPGYVSLLRQIGRWADL